MHAPVLGQLMYTYCDCISTPELVQHFLWNVLCSRLPLSIMTSVLVAVRRGPRRVRRQHDCVEESEQLESADGARADEGGRTGHSAPQAGLPPRGQGLLRASRTPPPEDEDSGQFAQWSFVCSSGFLRVWSVEILNEGSFQKVEFNSQLLATRTENVVSGI